jgi:AcrR family transcriptional regulator
VLYNWECKGNVSFQQSTNRPNRCVDNNKGKVLVSATMYRQHLEIAMIKMPGAVNKNDPRVQRTRQLLLQAFMTLLEERHNVHSISIQEITQLATVNRATFYAHFEDKYALLECWMREKFHRSFAHQLPASSTLQTDTLRLLILAVFHFLARFREQLKPADRQFEPLFEIAVQQELYQTLLAWLTPVISNDPHQKESVEVTASIISWAIFGPAAQWSRGERTIPAEEMAHHVLTVVIASLSPLITVNSLD